MTDHMPRRGKLPPLYTSAICSPARQRRSRRRTRLRQFRFGRPHSTCAPAASPLLVRRRWIGPTSGRSSTGCVATAAVPRAQWWPPVSASRVFDRSSLAAKRVAAARHPGVLPGREVRLIPSAPSRTPPRLPAVPISLRGSRTPSRCPSEASGTRHAWRAPPSATGCPRPPSCTFGTSALRGT